MFRVFILKLLMNNGKMLDNPKGSENHFGLINLKGEAKFALWDLVDQGVFEGLSRDGKSITKTFKGNKKTLMSVCKITKIENSMQLKRIKLIFSATLIVLLMGCNKTIEHCRLLFMKHQKVEIN